MILGVLNFNAHGPPYFVFNRDGSLRWPQGAVISEVWLEGSLQAFSNQSLAIVGDNDQQVKQHSSARSTLPRLLVVFLAKSCPASFIALRPCCNQAVKSWG